MINGKIVTYENNCMSLSCRGEMVIQEGVITHVYFKGYPRTYGDSWTYYYKKYKQGDEIDKSVIDKILSYNGKRNVISILK